MDTNNITWVFIGTFLICSGFIPTVLAEEFSDPTITITENQITGNVGSEQIDGMPVAITTISPTFKTENIAIKTEKNGDFTTELNLTEPGNYEIFVSYNGTTIKKLSLDVTDEQVSKQVGIDILKLRLSILETLERILEIVFGK